MNTLYILWSSEKEYKSIHKVTDLIINSGNGNRYILFLQGEYVDYSFCNAEVFFLKGNRRSIKGKRFYYFNKMKLLGELSKLIEKLSIDTIWLDGVGCLKFFSGIKKIQGYSINVIIHNEIRDVGVSRDFLVNNNINFFSVSDYLANSISNKIKLPVKSIRNLITTQNLTSDALAHAEKLFLEEKYTNKFKIASVGRLVKSKGVLDIIEFAEYLKEKNFDFVWYIFGDGELKNEIENKIIEKNLSEHLFLKGFVDNVDSYLKQFDLLVSFSYSEGLGLIIKEAIQANIAVATTPLPAFIEQLGDTGLYADHGDYDKWYQEIMLKLQSEQLRDKVVLSQTNHFLGKISSAFKTT